MKNFIDVEKRKRKIIKSFISVFLFFILVLSLSLFYIQVGYFQYSEALYQKSLNRIIKQIQFKAAKHYKDILLQISLDKQFKDYILQNRRKKAYLFLKPKFVLLKQENSYVEFLKLIKPNGEIFLRTCDEDKYGDKVDTKDTIVGNSIKKHIFTEGFENGIDTNSYKLVLPLFRDGNYIASLEIGINPNYFTETAKNALGAEAFLFVKKDSLALKHHKLRFHIEDYYLQSDTSTRDDELLRLFPQEMKLMPQNQIKFKNKIYTLHVENISKYRGGEYGKFIFLEDITANKNYQNSVRSYTLIILTLFLIVILYLINYYVTDLGSKLSVIYEEYTHKLISRKAYLKAILNATPDLLITLVDRSIKNVNDSFLNFTGFSSLDEFKKRHDCVCDLFLTREGYLSAYIKNEYWVDYIIKNKDIMHYAIIKKDGVEHIFRVYLNSIEFDKKIRYVITLADMTEIIHTKDELEKNQKLLIAQSKQAAMGEMISMIAHQWRQPLSIISMISNDIITDIKLDIYTKEAILENSEEIIQETNFLSQTIDDFRNFLKPEKEAQEVFVSKMVDNALGLVSKELKKFNIEVICDFEDKEAITTYSRELTQVLLSILSNAKDALEALDKEKKIIQIKTRKYNNNVSISIWDNGDGIDDKIIDRVFEPYFSTKEEKNGAGLGLYMCNTIVEKHLKGKIWVENKKEGVCFMIKLPMNLKDEEDMS